jgi:hypothetical protein
MWKNPRQPQHYAKGGDEYFEKSAGGIGKKYPGAPYHTRNAECGGLGPRKAAKKGHMAHGG